MVKTGLHGLNRRKITERKTTFLCNTMSWKIITRAAFQVYCDFESFTTQLENKKYAQWHSVSHPILTVFILKLVQTNSNIWITQILEPVMPDLSAVIFLWAMSKILVSAEPPFNCVYSFTSLTGDQSRCAADLRHAERSGVALCLISYKGRHTVTESCKCMRLYTLHMQWALMQKNHYFLQNVIEGTLTMSGL